MKPDIKRQWVAALRSGEYKQGKGTLHFTNWNGSETFCCLGVLCDLAMKDGLNLEKTFSPARKLRGEYANFDGHSSVLPPEVMKWAGLKSCDPVVPSGFVGRTTLSDLNDNRGYGFPAIADVIEGAESL